GLEIDQVAAHATHHRPDDDKVQLGDRARPLITAATVAAVIGLVAAVGLGFVAGDSFKRFFHAYLAAYGFVLSVGLGSLFFVVVQPLTRAGGGVSAPRLRGARASTMPLIGILPAPIVVSVVLNNGMLSPGPRPLNVGDPPETHGAPPAATHAADK